MMGGGGAPMGGLAAARPEASTPQEQPDLQAAASILQDAVSQFGPQILDVLKQLLESAPTSGGDGSGGAAPMTGMGM